MSKFLPLFFAPCGRVVLWLSLTIIGALPCVAAPSQEAPVRLAPRLVTLELRFADRSPIVVTVLDGDLVTVEHVALKYTIGLIPRISEMADGDVDLEVVAPPRRSGEVPGRLHERLRGREGFSSFTAAGGAALEVRVIAIGDKPGAITSCGESRKGLVALGPDDPSEMKPVGGCCMTCQSVTTCGCAVATACGTCCGCAFC